MKLSNEAKSKLSRLMADATDEENIGNRSDLLDRYLAEPYGDEIKGRSQFVSSDVADAVEAILPDIMDVFTSSENLLEFAPVGPDDEAAAKQETKAVDHVFWQQNPGFESLYVWIKEALIQQNAYVWRGWVEKERVEIEEYEELTFDELMGIIDQLEGEYEFQEQSGFEYVEDPETGDEVAVPEIGEDGMPVPISVKIRCIKTEKKYVIEPFPQEDFFGTPRWSRLGLEGIPCCGRRHRDKRKEDWIAFGFSEDSLDRVSDSVSDDEDTSSRHHTRDLDESEANDEAVEIYEAYVSFDANEDGRLELMRVWTTRDGSHILEWEDGTPAMEEVSHIPISALTPYIIPHRHIGRSVSEQVDDIQQVNTVLLRHMLDCVYFTNYPRPQFNEDEAGQHTFNDLQNPAPGAPVRTGGAEIFWQQPQSVAPTVLPMMEKFAALKEERVGATRYNQGLDSESLNKTASGINRIMNAGQKKTKLIARTIAETGLRDLFLGIHRDLRSGPMKQLVMKMTGQWVPVDPRTWKHRTDMVINVGMGRGDRDEIRAGLMTLGQVQRELRAAGSPMVTDQEIYNTIERVAGTFGIAQLDPFLKNPASLPPPPPPPPPPPDPSMMAVQAQAQKWQADAQRDAARLQAEEREKERAHQIKMAELQLKMAAERRQDNKTASDIQTDEERLDLDKRRAAMEDDFKRDKLEVDALTGLQRDTTRVVTSEPPVSYEQVTKD